MAKRHRPFRSNPKTVANPTTLRIVGGDMGGRKITYLGDQHVRPMKDRTREAVFNLIGPAAKETHVLDLFGGTGAMAIEAVSRGALSGTIIERHIPSAKTIQKNLEALQLESVVDLEIANAFRWSQQGLDGLPDCRWLVFACPPYLFFDEQLDPMKQLLQTVMDSAPVDSLLVVEAKIPFDFDTLKLKGTWKIRNYRPATVGVLKKEV